ERHEIGVGRDIVETCIAGARDADMVLPDKADAGFAPGKILDDINGTVGRAIVHNDDIEFGGIGLPQKGTQRRSDELFAVERRNNYADLHNFIPTIKSATVSDTSAGSRPRSSRKHGSRFVTSLKNRKPLWRSPGI